MKPIRLMQVVPDLGLGGLQQVVLSLCRKIDRNRFDLSVLCLNERGPFAEQVQALGIEVILLPQKKSGNDYIAFPKVAKVFRQKQVQVLHTHNTQPFLDSVMASRLYRVQRIIHTDHARDFPDKKRYMAMEWMASHFVDQIVGVSEHTSQNLHRYEKIPLRKIVTIPNGIDESVYDFSIDKEALKKELGITRKGPVMGLGVRLSAQKGIKYLLSAMPRIITTHPEITLIIAGDGPLKADLENQAKDLGLDNHVRFIGPRNDMPRIMKVLDLYVLPSVWEGLPMVILESLAAGCPIVATDVGGNATAIKHRYNGSLLPSKAPEALAEEIIFLLNNPDVLLQYVENGKNVFNEQFSATIMARRYERLYLQEQ